MLRPSIQPCPLAHAVAAVPAGAWAVGVSGGADSVCLLALLRDRPDLTLHVAHLNHQTRGAESDGDAAFVEGLAREWGMPYEIGRLQDFDRRETANPHARFRAARFAFFADVVGRHRLDGVILAHHADDQAETVLHRLLRETASASLAGIPRRSIVAGITVLHPLLAVPREALRAELLRREMPWREDASNASPRYARNRIRQLLERHPALTSPLLELSTASAQLRAWLDRTAPELGDAFHAADVSAVPRPLAEHALRRWLCARGVTPADVNRQTLERLLAMATDAASPARQHFPGKLLVARRRGRVFVVAASSS